jgi:transcriptional regulator with XRE-family HTH domain
MRTRQDELMADPGVRRTFEEELLIGEATDTIAGLLESLQLSQRLLAERLGVSEGRVSQILSGAENLTLKSLAACGWALGVRFELTPAAMADRSGTPALNDPSAPLWLSALKPQPVVVFKDLPFPGRGKIDLPSSVIRLQDGWTRAA